MSTGLLSHARCTTVQDLARYAGYQVFHPYYRSVIIPAGAGCTHFLAVDQQSAAGRQAGDKYMISKLSLPTRLASRVNWDGVWLPISCNQILLTGFMYAMVEIA